MSQALAPLVLRPASRAQNAQRQLLMLKFTLDTNCIIDVDENRSNACAIRALAEAHKNGIANVAVVAIMASEKQRPGDMVSNFGQFQKRLLDLSLNHLGLCLPLGRFDITFFDHCIFAGPNEVELERKIHLILFPNLELNFQHYCNVKKISSDLSAGWQKSHEPWRKALCDVQALWNHINAQRNVFVSSDGNFLKVQNKAALLALGAGKIEYPTEAVALL